jgi:hypothetical protein
MIPDYLFGLSVCETMQTSTTLAAKRFPLAIVTYGRRYITWTLQLTTARRYQAHTLRSYIVYRRRDLTLKT